MGYGGALIWTGLFRNIKLKYPDKKIILVYKKTLRNIITNSKNNDFVIYENKTFMFELEGKDC